VATESTLISASETKGERIEVSEHHVKKSPNISIHSRQALEHPIPDSHELETIELQEFVFDVARYTAS
jgi:hypothetical protein